MPLSTKSPSTVFVLAVLFLLPTAICQAVLVSIGNPSFEAVALSEGQFTVPPASIPDWSYDGVWRKGTWNPPGTIFYGGVIPDGLNVAYNEGGTISQVLVETLSANAIYTLNVDVGRPVAISQDYSVQLFAGATLLAEDVNGLSLAQGNLGGSFQTSVVTFQTFGSHAELGQPLEIRLNVLNGRRDHSFDKVLLDVTAIPEPSGFLFGGLLTTTCGVKLGVRRRNRILRCT